MENKKKSEYILELIKEFEFQREKCMSPYCDMNRISEVEILSILINALRAVYSFYIENPYKNENLKRMMDSQNLCAEAELDGHPSPIKNKEELIEQFKKDWAPQNEYMEIIDDETMNKYLNIKEDSDGE